jgi:uncharacterized protein DUF4824
MTRRWLLFAAALIVCVTNVVALGLGLLNRRYAPEGAIMLTERELRMAPSGLESTATFLRLVWRSPDNDGFACDRIRPLGFACPDSREATQPSRHGYVVLEYDGAAFERLRQHDEALQAQLAAENPSVATSPPWWRNEATRLVVVDLGPDADALRRIYPDRSRYLISLARIGVRDAPGGTLTGFVPELLPSTINVPLPFSKKLRDAAALHAGDPPKSWTPRYTVTLRYGRFLEPWIVDVGQ